MPQINAVMRQQLRTLLGASALLLGGVSAHAVNATPLILETPTYDIRIETLCEEGLVTCRKVRYVGTNKRTRQSVRLMGYTVPTSCRNDVPCRLQAYEFVNGVFGYYVTRDGALIVTRGDEILLREHGVWK
jgi:hypothetical protein